MFTLDALLNGNFEAEAQAAMDAIAKQAELRDMLMDCSLAEYLEAGRARAIITMLKDKRYGELSMDDIKAQAKVWHAHERVIMANAIAWAEAISTHVKEQEKLAVASENEALKLYALAVGETLIEWTPPTWYMPPTAIEAVTMQVEVTVVATPAKEKKVRVHKAKAQSVVEATPEPDNTATLARKALEDEFGSNGIWLMSKQDIAEVVGMSALDVDMRAAVLASL